MKGFSNPFVGTPRKASTLPAKKGFSNPKGGTPGKASMRLIYEMEFQITHWTPGPYDLLHEKGAVNMNGHWDEFIQFNDFAQACLLQPF
jgi:hypothetical protein